MTETLPANSGASLLYSAPVSINPATANLVRKSTRRAYRGVLERLDAWLDGVVLDDEALTDWNAGLDERGLSAGTAAFAVAAARFRASMAGHNGKRPRRGR